MCSVVGILFVHLIMAIFLLHFLWILLSHYSHLRFHLSHSCRLLCLSFYCSACCLTLSLPSVAPRCYSTCLPPHSVLLNRYLTSRCSLCSHSCAHSLTASPYPRHLQ